MPGTSEGGASAPPLRSTGKKSNVRQEITRDDARRWFTETADMPTPTETLLSQFIELASLRPSPDGPAGHNSARLAREFLHMLEQEHQAMVAAVTPPMSPNDLRRILDDIGPGLGDSGVADAKARVDEARRLIDAAGHAAAEFLNWHRQNFDRRRKAWHDAARTIAHAAELTCAAAGSDAFSPTPNSPLVEFVALALSDLGFRNPKGEPLSADAVSAVLTGKRGRGA